MALALTSNVTRALEVLCDEPQRKILARRLKREAGRNIPFHKDSKPHDMDRIRLSIIKLIVVSGWDEDEAFKEAKVDWRDLFCASGFAHVVDEHKNWFRNISGEEYSEPEIRKVGFSSRWMFWRE